MQVSSEDVETDLKRNRNADVCLLYHALEPGTTGPILADESQEIFDFSRATLTKPAGIIVWKSHAAAIFRGPALATPRTVGYFV